MAISIYSNSPLQAQVQSVYMNDTTYENEVFWTDDAFAVPAFTYIVTRWIPELQLHKIVAHGNLKGRLNENGFYDYRFNFDKYIRIPKLDFSNIVKVNNYFSYIDGINSSRVALLINTGDILTINSPLITINANGEYFLNSGVDPDDVVANRFEYFFKDRKTYDSLYYDDELIANSIFPITVFAEIVDTTLYYASTFTGYSLSTTTGYDFKIGLYSVPSDVRRLEIFYNSALTNIYPTEICSNDYFYVNTDGYFDVIRATGTKRLVDNVEKNNIQLNNNIIISKAIITKQIVQNTGFLIDETKVYDILQAGIVYVLTSNSGTITAKEYVIDNDTFDGYSGKRLSDKNVEITLTDTKKYERIQQKEIGFFD